MKGGALLRRVRSAPHDQEEKIRCRNKICLAEMKEIILDSEKGKYQLREHMDKLEQDLKSCKTRLSEKERVIAEAGEKERVIAEADAAAGEDAERWRERWARIKEAIQMAITVLSDKMDAKLAEIRATDLGTAKAQPGQYNDPQMTPEKFRMIMVKPLMDDFMKLAWQMHAVTDKKIDLSNSSDIKGLVDQFYSNEDTLFIS